jgi:2-polyprenyl-3-methyl-5-hydroxy-6-metoxy-1,4-benzoquinol methylase
MADPDDTFRSLERINERPRPYSRYTADALWSSPEISEMLLRFHLDGGVDVASRRTDFIEASVEWITSTFDLGPGKRIIDLGCGPGLYTNRLARTGASVTGIDLSPRSIEYAREAAKREGVKVDHVLGDYLEYEPDEGFDLALMIMCDFCAFDPDQRGRLIRRVSGMLQSEGAFLFDVYSLALFGTWEEEVAYGPSLMDGFWSSSPYFGFLNTFRYAPERLVLEKYVIVQEDRTSEYFNWFQHYEPDSLSAELETHGLRVDRVLGDVAGADYDAEAPEFAVIARRRETEPSSATRPSTRRGDRANLRT